MIRLRQLLRWLGISEADMEKAHLRCDANVSIRAKGETILNPKTEIKNVNSIDAVRDAIENEIERQIREVEAGKRIEAWTLEWDEDTGTLKKMRSKETEADYRYFREPDLLPIRLTEEWKAQILADFPELPLARRARFVEQYRLPEYDADILTSERKLSDYYEYTVKAYGGDPKKVSNWLMNDVLRMINDQGLNPAEMKLTPAALAEYPADGGQGHDQHQHRQGAAAEGAGQRQERRSRSWRRRGWGWSAMTAPSARCARSCWRRAPTRWPAYKAGKVTLIGWFVGGVMKKMRGKADAALARKILEELLLR